MITLIGFVVGAGLGLVVGWLASSWAVSLPQHLDTPTLRATIDEYQRELWRRS